MQCGARPHWPKQFNHGVVENEPTVLRVFVRSASSGVKVVGRCEFKVNFLKILTKTFPLIELSQNKESKWSSCITGRLCVSRTDDGTSTPLCYYMLATATTLRQFLHFSRN